MSLVGFLSKGMYLDLKYEPIFQALKEDMEEIEEYDSMLIGAINGVKVAIYSNLSMMFIEKSTSLPEMNNVLYLLESTIDHFVKGFKYKVSEEIIEYRLIDALYRNGKIKDRLYLTLAEAKCVNDLMRITI